MAPSPITTDSGIYSPGYIGEQKYVLIRDDDTGLLHWYVEKRICNGCALYACDKDVKIKNHWNLVDIRNRIT